MTYYAWVQDGDTPKFTGPVNRKSGKRSQAGSLSAFASRKARDEFLSLSRGAVAVTADEARQLKAGLDQQAFEQLVAFSVGCDQ